MIRFTPETLYGWLSDYDSFSYEFKRFCFQIGQAFGLSLEFDSNTLKLAHQKWHEDSEIWRTQHFPNEADALSHIKLVALLLHHLSSSPFFSGVYEHDFQKDPDYRFAGNEHHFQEARGELIAAREAILSLDFCLSIICWYEERRIDREQAFEFRMTRDLRHDIISHLVSRKTDPKSLYLILKALFIRPPKKKTAANSPSTGAKPGAAKPRQ
jgi:hypothetical protein